MSIGVHIKSWKVKSVVNLENYDECIVLPLKQEDITIVNLEYDTDAQAIKVSEIPSERVGQTFILCEKESSLLILDQEFRGEMIAGWYTVTDFVFRELDRVELSFGKKVTSKDGSWKPVYSSTDTSDRVIPFFQSQYNTAIAGA